MPSAYFTERIIYSLTLKSAKSSGFSLVRHFLYKMNKIGDRHHPRLTSRPILTLLASPWSSFILTALSMYSLVIDFLARQSIPFTFRICINLVQFTPSPAFCQSMKHTHTVPCLRPKFF